MRQQQRLGAVDHRATLSAPHVNTDQELELGACVLPVPAEIARFAVDMQRGAGAHDRVFDGGKLAERLHALAGEHEVADWRRAGNRRRLHRRGEAARDQRGEQDQETWCCQHWIGSI